jgi:mono/diheme cytochrome c family protein
MTRIAIAVLALGVFAGCDRAAEEGSRAAGGMDGAMVQPSAGGAVDTTGLRALPVPAEHVRGRELFEATCSVCHGEAGLGTAQGPPLVHIIYEPNHHGDAAFVFAAERGVRAHHWGFGDMPPQPAITRPEVMEVVGYVRWLQREAGVW